ncbi:hypothetical protein BO99DRAFT_68560 [Aspergillus violaceofuscus CBS 115571]|uniref:Uncharacterized protein n=1 Tax=Aspergillus violaceofuscus (strain CBS 115571) TaxID=1450538 RepID=A0A2V5HJ92_ASPV1|nr:hypothetical protein BO99DRAFT_68560 [Aspergillus violaceofuscus CBS 115571]
MPTLRDGTKRRGRSRVSSGCSEWTESSLDLCGRGLALPFLVALLQSWQSRWVSRFFCPSFLALWPLLCLFLFCLCVFVFEDEGGSLERSRRGGWMGARWRTLISPNEVTRYNRLLLDLVQGGKGREVIVQETLGNGGRL